MKFYVARISKIIAKDSNGNELDQDATQVTPEEGTPTFEVRFYIPNIMTNMDKYPRAIPLFNHVRELHIDDPIIVLQFNDDLHEFGYFPVPIDNNIIISNGNTSVNFTDINNIEVTVVDNYLSDEPHKLTEIIINNEGITTNKYADDGETVLSNVVQDNENINLIKNDDGGAEISSIKMTNDSIIVDSNNATVTLENNSITSEIEGGASSIITNSEAKLEMGTQSLTMDNSGVTISATGTIKLSKPGAQITANGTAAAGVNGTGGFCGLPFCLFTGAPQTSPTLISTDGMSFN